ncbi:protein WHAT'S THIS FACTOR 1 homolog [Cucurbita pepo subsp. pepo]|uniref:protein WHAT'S THIS FACTOR 1 homolog n=1 Tax=Cucurbita pepo subsp. pepo TaxID=3664 RepID=UPI000C9D6EB6|nr:protein WHAT'S THIS FACTOR 1 homolog [Cucurbita pepo subsp. pepo]XP_023548909.1 protein WHAT'S THIS FACTOR 1 homolog [Cucurbita pepo subsp. pepo]XP_023548910.1 protein WHAT'S THIS FACTOR 1 homolog [Cucurbita pepo subsp. pepo]
MLSTPYALFSCLRSFKSAQSSFVRRKFVLQIRDVSSLKVIWRKDSRLDEAIENDKRYKLCARVVREVLNEPGQVIPLRYLEKRRQRLRLNVSIKTFMSFNPGLLDTYYDRIKPKSEPVLFLRPSDRLRGFLVNLVPKYPEYFQIIGSPGDEKSFLQLVSRNPNFAKSVIERRAEDESISTGIDIRPNFNYNLPPGFFLRKEMREWVRDWLELDYISPYEDVSHLAQASPEMEKRTVGVFHELLSLSLFKRIPVPILGKFSDEYRFSNAFSSVFTRHSGIFYLSLKGGIETAMLREAYKGSQLIDCDPLLEIKDKFVELLEEGWRERAEQRRQQAKQVRNDMEFMAARADA